MSEKKVTNFSQPGSKGEMSAWVLSTARWWWGGTEEGRERERNVSMHEERKHTAVAGGIKRERKENVPARAAPAGGTAPGSWSSARES